MNSDCERQNPATTLQPSEPEVIRFSGQSPETGKICILSCHSMDHRVKHLCQNASPPKEITLSGAFGEWCMKSDCVTSWKRVRTEPFVGSRRAAKNTVTQQATQQNRDKLKPTCHHCKKPVSTEISAIKSNKKKTITPQMMLTTIITTNWSNKLAQITGLPKKSTQTMQTAEMAENHELSTHLVRPVLKPTNP